MAKTKGSNPPVTEEIYTDAGGITYYFGEFFRDLFSEGSVSPSDPTVDITGQSTRGMRPSQQGAGSAAQEEIRNRYKSCIALWNSLPLVCPDPLPDPPPTSKESVWDAKLEHGVVCSYFDLFMRCCLKWARDHDGDMPDGDCFPCISLCTCENISIEYTTGGMQVSEQQTLSVSNPVDGCVYLWAIESGGGSLSSDSGNSVTYTAPGSNASCLQNVSISLSVGDAQCDIVHIAINGFTVGFNAYKVLVCLQDRFCEIVGSNIYCTTTVRWYYYNCWGGYKSNSLCYSGGKGSTVTGNECPAFCTDDPVVMTCEQGAASKGCGSIGNVVDLRTPLMIEQGCCPESLL